MFNLLCSQGHRPIFHQALGAEVVVFDEGLDGVAVFNFVDLLIRCIVFSSAVLTHFICFASAVFATYGS